MRPLIGKELEDGGSERAGAHADGDVFVDALVSMHGFDEVVAEGSVAVVESSVDEAVWVSLVEGSGEGVGAGEEGRGCVESANGEEEPRGVDVVGVAADVVPREGALVAALGFKVGRQDLDALCLRNVAFVPREVRPFLVDFAEDAGRVDWLLDRGCSGDEAPCEFEVPRIPRGLDRRDLAGRAGDCRGGRRDLTGQRGHGRAGNTGGGARRGESRFPRRGMHPCQCRQTTGSRGTHAIVHI